MAMIDLLHEALNESLKLGADYVEVRAHISTFKGYVMKNGEEDPLRLSTEEGVSIRALVDGALGFASTNILDKTYVHDIAQRAFKIAKAASTHPRERVNLSRESMSRGEWTTSQQIRLADVSLDEKFKLLSEIEDWIKPETTNTTLPYRILVLSESEEKKTYANSEGSEITSTIPRVGFNFILTAQEMGKGSAQRMMEIGNSAGWEAVKEWGLQDLVQKEARILGKTLREAERPPRGEVDLVLGPEVVGIICHESCGHPQEADRILGREAAQAGESYLKPHMIGTRIGSEKVTILDNPTIPKSFGFYLYDDEGVKAAERILIEKGVIKNFLHNRETAAKLETTSNGAARAVAYDREPIVRMANTYMKPGDYTFDELIEGVHQGVYMKSFTEWNIDDRRFNQRYVGLEAYRIINGKIAGLVRNPVLEITTPSLYGSVDAVSSNLSFEAATCGKGEPMQPAPVWHGGPEIRLRKIRLGGV
ncbi:TldD/PmbA family protein [[Eubacterium] cellulosolvens]